MVHATGRATDGQGAIAQDAGVTAWAVMGAGTGDDGAVMGAGAGDDGALRSVDGASCSSCA